MNNKFDSKYQTIYFEENKKMVVQVWTSATSEINDEIFKAEMLKVKEFCDNFVPDFLVLNTLNFDYVLGNDMQQWVFENINRPVISSIPHLRSAFVMPETLIPKLSLEQTLDGPKRLAALAYFTNEKDAFSWLLEKE